MHLISESTSMIPHSVKARPATCVCDQAPRGMIIQAMSLALTVVHKLSYYLIYSLCRNI